MYKDVKGMYGCNYVKIKVRCGIATVCDDSIEGLDIDLPAFNTKHSVTILLEYFNVIDCSVGTAPLAPASRLQFS